jgi:hypothetical protein
MLHPDPTEDLLQLMRDAGPSVVLFEKINGHATALYWEAKDASSALALLDGATAAALSQLEAGAVPRDEALLRQLKTLLYNLASFGWLGWGEAWAIISPEHQEVAVAAAQAHLRIARELPLPPLKMSRALWLSAALSIQANDLKQAREHFEASALLAREAGEVGEAANATAFALLSAALSGDREAESAFIAFLSQMQDSPEAAAFATQPATAWAVFRPRFGR